MLIINKVEPVKIRKEELGKEQQKDFLNRYCTKKGKKEEKKKEGLGEEQQKDFLSRHCTYIIFVTDTTDMSV